MITIFIDGSAKENMIGAGLVVDTSDSPLFVGSFDQTLNGTASSSQAEFFALQKALQWIESANPNQPIAIFTDSMEVVDKTERGMIPYFLKDLYKQITYNYSISIKHALSDHESMILKAHNASRSYITKTVEKTFKHNPLIWICLRQESEWIVTNREGDILAVNLDPVEALYEAVFSIVEENPLTTLYFDLIATQIIRYHSTQFPSRMTSYLISLLDKRISFKIAS
jgi:ribonuclease HI